MLWRAEELACGACVEQGCERSRPQKRRQSHFVKWSVKLWDLYEHCNGPKTFFFLWKCPISNLMIVRSAVIRMYVNGWMYGYTDEIVVTGVERGWEETKLDSSARRLFEINPPPHFWSPFWFAHTLRLYLPPIFLFFHPRYLKLPFVPQVFFFLCLFFLSSFFCFFISFLFS